MNKALLDTDILSEILKQKNKAVSGRARAYHAQYGQFTISAATVMEVVRGFCRLEAHGQLEIFLEHLDDTEVLPIDQDIAVLAGRVDGVLSKTGMQVGINDVLIGATAIQHGLTLVTGNIRHYRRIPQVGFPLELDNWREPPTSDN